MRDLYVGPQHPHNGIVEHTQLMLKHLGLRLAFGHLLMPYFVHLSSPKKFGVLFKVEKRGNCFVRKAVFVEYCCSIYMQLPAMTGLRKCCRRNGNFPRAFRKKIAFPFHLLLRLNMGVIYPSFIYKV